MTIENFIKKTLKHIIVLVVVTIIISGLGDALGTIVSNQLALESLTNSDLAFILQESYNNIVKPCFTSILIGVYIWNIGLIVYNTGKFIYVKYKEKENEEL